MYHCFTDSPPGGSQALPEAKKDPLQRGSFLSPLEDCCGICQVEAWSLPTRW